MRVWFSRQFKRYHQGSDYRYFQLWCLCETIYLFRRALKAPFGEASISCRVEGDVLRYLVEGRKYPVFHVMARLSGFNVSIFVQTLLGMYLAPCVKADMWFLSAVQLNVHDVNGPARLSVFWIAYLVNQGKILLNNMCFDFVTMPTRQ